MSQRRAQFFGDLARLTGAGIPVSKAGAIIQRRSRDSSSTFAIKALQDGLQRGDSIAVALQPSLTGMEFRMVAAAESGGHLSAGFAHLQRYYKLLAAAREKMRTAAIYPLLILHVAAATNGVVAILNQRPPLPAVAAGIGVLWAALAAMWLIAQGVIGLGRRSLAADAFLRRLPVAGGVWRNLALARWSSVMHFYIISGQKFAAALDAAAEAAGSAGLAAASRRLSAVAAAGHSMGDAMCGERVFPDHFAAGFSTAEETGTLDTETALQMEGCMESATSSMALLAEWLPRLLYFGALIYGAWQVLKLASAIGWQYQRALHGF